MKRNKSGLFLAGVVGTFIGGCTGFVLGVLLAPQEGKKTKRRLVYKLDNLAGQLSDLIDHALRPDQEGDAQRSGDALVEDARDRAQRIRDDIDNLLKEVQGPSSGAASPAVE